MPSSFRNILVYRLRRNFSKIKLNPLRNERQLMRLNPYAAVEKDLARIMQAKGIARKAEKMKRIEVKVSILYSCTTSIEILSLRI